MRKNKKANGRIADGTLAWKLLYNSPANDSQSKTVPANGWSAAIRQARERVKVELSGPILDADLAKAAVLAARKVQDRQPADLASAIDSARLQGCRQ